MKVDESMDIADYNAWAAEFVGEDEQGIAEAIRIERYTTSFAAAALVFEKSISCGILGEIRVDPFGNVEVQIHGIVVKGTRDNLARTVTEAACLFDAWTKF
jgi:hypothetical protein